MLAAGLTFLLFFCWWFIGYAVVSVLRRGRLLQNMLLAPAVGTAVCVMCVFWLNRAGIPISKFGPALGVCLLLGSAILWWRACVIAPFRRYIPFAVVFVIAFLLVAWPMLEYGFNWVSISNADMANYSLTAQRMYNYGYFERLSQEDLVKNLDMSAYYIIHVDIGTRMGSDMLLAFVMSMTHLSAHHAYMSVIIALHLCLLSAAGALFFQRRKFIGRTLMALAILSCSAEFTLGTIYQLIAQVFGLALFTVCAVLLMSHDTRSGRNYLLKQGTLLAFVFSAGAIVYPEVIPFFGLACVLFWAARFLRNSSIAGVHSCSIAVVRSCCIAGLLTVVFLNSYGPLALRFLFQQARAGGGHFAGGEDAPVLFPFFLLPSGLAQFWGIAPFNVIPSEPVLSVGILFGGVLILLSGFISVREALCGTPAAFVSVSMFVAAVWLAFKESDYGLFKIAMFIQPFLIPTLVAAWMRFMKNKENTRFFRKFQLGLPLLLIPLGIYGQQYYVHGSKGTGKGSVEIQRASENKIVDQLESLGKTVNTKTVVTDSSSESLIKFESAYFQGRQFLTPVKQVFRPSLKRDVGAESRERREFDLLTGELKQRFNGFQENQQTEQVAAAGNDATLIVSAGHQTALNRSSFRGNSDRELMPIPWKNVSNFLIFIDSDKGHSMLTGNRFFTSLFPVFIEGLTNSPVAPVGRYLLFRVVNPADEFRLVLNLSALNRQLPPASVVGQTRERLDVIGSGSVRAVSPPIKPQLINRVPYICIDMGAEPVPLTEVRKGLMALWGTALPFDYKRYVGLARNISIVSEEEYRRFRAPAEIKNIPEDFLNHEFEYSGAYEDGWLSANSYFIFSGSNTVQPLVIRGLVPEANDSAFTTNLTVIVDGQEVGRKNLKTGEFEYRFSVPANNGRRRVDLRFDKTQPLRNDLRRGAALLRCLGFDIKACEAKDSPDIITDGKGIWRGDNWYPLEKQNGKSFRWAHNDAEILVSPEAGSRDVSIDLEPGPGLGGEPMKLEARASDGQVLFRKDVAHRQKVQFQLASLVNKTDGLSTIRLHSLNGGRPVAGDARILNFRVFQAALQTAASASKAVAANDVVTGDDVVQLGANWNPIESLGADHFRWVDNDAVISVSDPRVLAKGLTLELEPGPGIKKKPMILRMLDSAGRQVQAMEITGRQTINVFPPPATKKPVEFRLHVDGGGQKIASDPRILNFRVFKIYSAAHGASAGGEIAEGAGLQIGKGWYPVESFTDGTFRWVNNDAEFTVDATRTHAVEIELQPGPGFDFKKMVVKVLDSSGRQVQAAEVNGRQTVRLLLPSGKGKDVMYRLHVDGGGKKIASDPRTLNFRVFKLKALD